MNFKTAYSLVTGGRLRLLWNATRLFTPFYRISFVAAAATSGLLRRLADGPQTLAALAPALAPDPATHAALEAWLGLGVRLGELALGPDGYRLHGFLARQLADEEHDHVAALLEEVVSFHHRLIWETPHRLRRGERWQVDDHDGRLIARSSRIMEPFLFQLIDWAVPTTGALALLEVGCGSGTYMRYAAKRNPELRALGVEMQSCVADVARLHIAGWGLQDRLTVETGDIRSRHPEPRFDVVTLYNAIYYFPVAERVELLRKLGSFLRPGGRLIVSTSCRGGSPGMQMLDVWTSSVDGFGPLPSEEELAQQIRAAGFDALEARSVIPGERYVAILGTLPG
jgi:4-hydroxy-2,2'-bipyrrole-5-carbaldehyde O-methyltransferase